MHNNFIEKAKKVHSDKYNYSLVDYKNLKTNIIIFCPKHGEFEQRPDHHMNGSGCPFCAKEKKKKYNSSFKKLTTEEFIKRAKKVHSDKYDYSLVNYKNNHTNVIIICPEHGEFEQRPDHHMNGSGCLKCHINKIKKQIKTFIKEANIVHNNFYDYSLVDYKNKHTKIKIKCPEHGEFEQSPKQHLKGQGCPKCAIKKIRLKTIERLNNNLENGYQIIPSFNPKACEIFDKIMKENNVYIQHAMNDGEFYIKELGYWVDGYDKENNTVYEYDEKYHKKHKQQEKDKIREKEIKKLLKCKFIRIKEK